MSKVLSPAPKLTFWDSDGNPLVGGLLYTYEAGSVTPLATYTDSTGDTENENPIELDARGEASVWLNENTAYKFVLKTAAGVTIYTQDYISGAGGSSSATGYITPDEFGAVGDGVADDTAAVESALDAVKALIATNNWAQDLDVGEVPSYVEFDGRGKQYLVSDQIEIGAGFIGMHMHSFSFVAGSGFTSNTGTLDIDHDTGYITPTGTLKAILKIGSADQRSCGHNTFSDIFLECNHYCDGLYSNGTVANKFDNIRARHYKRYGMRWHGQGANTENKMKDLKAFQWTFGEAESNTFTAVGIAFESADMMSTGTIANNNKVDLYFARPGSHSHDQIHVYQHYVDSTDTTKFPQIENATDSGNANSTASGNKIRLKTYSGQPHGLSTGDRIYVGWLPGVSGTAGAATGCWTEVTVIDTDEVDCDETAFAGSFDPWNDTVTFTGGGSADITYAGVDVSAVDNTVTFETTGTLPTGITAGETYYITAINTGTNVFTVSETEGGSDITFSGTGSGTHTVYWRTWTPRIRREEHMPIGVWIAPNVASIWLTNLQLDGVRLRNYSRTTRVMGALATVQTDAQRAGYPWFDHRVLTASDNLGGLMLTDIRLGGSVSKQSFYAQGSGSIVEPLRCVLSNIVAKGGTSDETRGYAEVVFGAGITGASSTGLSGTKTGTITVDGNAVALSVDGASVPTLNDLADYVVTTAFTAGYDVTSWVISSTDRLRFTSTTEGVGSTVTLSGNIFTDLTNYSSLARPVDGRAIDTDYYRTAETTMLVANGGSSTDPMIVFARLSTDLTESSTTIERSAGFYSPDANVIGIATERLPVMAWDDAQRTLCGVEDSVEVASVHRKFQQHVAASTAGALFAQYSADAVGPCMVLGKSRATTAGVPGTIASANDVAGNFQFAADNGTLLKTGAGVSGVVETGWADATRKMTIQLQTTELQTLVGRWNVTSAGHLIPVSDNTYNIGSDALEVKEIWCTDTSINTSDERRKIITGDVPGLDFLTHINPIAFKWKVSGVKVDHVEDLPAIVDEKGVELEPAVIREIRTEKPGVRTHFGLSAQQVREAMTAAGLEDFAGWLMADPNDEESRQFLRYGEFIPVLIQAVKEQQALIGELSARVEALEK